MADITGYADKLFYHEWWNSDTLGHHWKERNLPAYNFFERHVCSPQGRKGVSKLMNVLTVFAISSIMHEHAIAVIFGVGTGMGFFGIMSSLLIIVLRDLSKANGITLKIMIWAVLCIIGLPLGAVINYYLIGTS